MTDKDKLYDWICQMSETKQFEDIDVIQGTYFKDYNEQPTLIEYDFENKKDIEHYLDLYFDNELLEIKSECVKSIIKSINEYAENSKEKKTNKNQKNGIHEYIYNF